VEDNGTKICVNIAYPNTDERYLEKVMKRFVPVAEAFRPEMILHNLGHDTCQLDYGDLGLTPEFYPRLVREIRACARRICHGRYMLITQGGKRADVAEYIFPRIIEVLAEP
jgi:acetoin utilization deacetylase AcuC-like enzyme